MTRIAVVVFPGSNCEYDALTGVESLGADAELVWHSTKDLSGFDGVIFPAASPTVTTCDRVRWRDSHR